ncbi:hypothetical protein [Streptomyces sp. NPDC005262]|uniref:hypothetical protein n=1 Tax=Streptomyces sp. NPDC005262 TaxID=3364710 RepID=UPI0036CCECD2
MISRRLHERYVSPQVEGHLWTPAVGKKVIEDGCTEAIASGVECLTETLLDTLPLTLAGVGRDAEAGEIPTVPAASARRPRAGRGRNTAFDDHGPAASDTA